VWCRKANSRNFNFCFYPAQCGYLEDPFECEVLYYPKEHETDQRATFDYALLKLKKAYKKASDFIPLAASIKDSEEAKWKMLAIYGYPAEKYSRNNYGEEKVSQWGYTRKGGVFGLGENEDEIFHKMTTLPGQSGCPIIEIGPKRCLSIVGIHKGGKNNAEIKG
jgi:V8-like Glu-specific endopeptidase